MTWNIVVARVSACNDVHDPGQFFIQLLLFEKQIPLTFFVFAAKRGKNVFSFIFSKRLQTGRISLFL
jgi:hypothetical protein